MKQSLHRSGKQGDLCRRGSKNTTGIHDSRTQTSAVSEHAYETGHFPIWNEVKLLLIEILTGCYSHITSPFTLGIVEFKFLKHGCPESKYTITGERCRWPVREQLLSGTMEQWEDRNVQITADLCDINDAEQSVDICAWRRLAVSIAVETSWSSDLNNITIIHSIINWATEYSAANHQDYELLFNLI